MPTRVTVLFEYPALNGGERSWLACLDGLRSEGFSVDAIVPAYADYPHPLAQELQHRDVPARQLRYHEVDGERRSLAAIREDLAALLRDDPPELLHANSLSTARISGPVCQELGVRSLGHLRDIIRLSKRAVADAGCHSRLLAVSQATRDHHIAQGFPIEKVRVCYNGIDTDRFRPWGDQPGRLREQFGADTRIMLSVGQISLRKGFDTVAAACEESFASDSRLHWLIAGVRHSTKPETVAFDEQLRAQAERPPLQGRVHFLGMIENMHELLPQCDLLVHAARQEALGRVLLEAAACGVPVVATDVGGTREIFCRDLATLKEPAARLVSPEDPRRLADAIRDAFENEAATRRMAAEARAICRERFSVERAVEGMVTHYRATA